MKYLGAFYFFHFAVFGVVALSWPLYLKSLSFSPVEIGELMAIFAMTKIVAPYIWAHWSAQLERPFRIVPLTTFAALVLFCFLYWARAYMEMAVVLTLFSFFWNAALPNTEAETLRALGDNRSRYGAIRAVGFDRIYCHSNFFGLGDRCLRYAAHFAGTDISARRHVFVDLPDQAYSGHPGRAGYIYRDFFYPSSKTGGLVFYRLYGHAAMLCRVLFFSKYFSGGGGL